MIRAELFRRAVQGVEEPVVSAGKLVRNIDGTPLTVRKYSDALMAALAKARLAEFKDKPVEVHSRMEVVERSSALAVLSDNELEQVEALIEAAQKRQGATQDA